MKNSNDVVEQDLGYICNGLENELDTISGKRLLITGGAGFLGYYLVQTILRWNTFLERPNVIQVTVYDNFARGMPRWLAKLQTEQYLSIVKHDITDPLPANITDFQYIIHGATIASPTYYRKHPIATMDANVNGLRQLLEYCRYQSESGKPIEGFLFLSSSEVYGDPPSEYIPTPESYWGNVSCTGPRACYDESKRYGETLCVNFGRQYGLPIKIARPFNNYGPGLKITDKRALPDFSRDVLEGRDLVLLSNGLPTRTFCYVADAIIGYYKVLINGREGEPYNIGVEEPEISLGELAEHVVTLAKELFGYKGKVVRGTSPDRDYLVDNPNRRCPMIRRAKAELAYYPAISIEEGLRRSLIWYNENRDAEEES